MGKKSKIKKLLSPSNTPSSNQSPPAILDDEDLMDDLIAQIETNDQVAERASKAAAMQQQQSREPTPSDHKQDSKSRYEARQARKAAALAQTFTEGDPAADARLEKEAKDEEKAINRICEELGLQIIQINPDGHCLFSAVADQLALLSVLPSSQANYATVRSAASSYMYTHPDDFLPFLPSVDGEDGPGSHNAGLMSMQQYERYCQSIRSTAMWGGEPEILALSRAYNLPIHVVQSGEPPVVIHNPVGTPLDGDIRDPKAVRISYHRRMYGLGEATLQLPQAQIIIYPDTA
ncbi:OTU protein [Marasmius crinis-equi]|uniref:OTU protein n=1 Tax=Marasmius crinis-equi TaxID=585013 RepID=A0ABR3FXZ7_9AGAR